MGRNWSAIVCIREEHEPSDLYLAAAGTVLIVGEFRALIAFAIVLASFYLKARKEEHWLAHEFGERFEAHAERTAMFVPRFS